MNGTQIEANANRYQFVYKTRMLSARKKLFSKISDDIISMNFERGFHSRNVVLNEFYGEIDKNLSTEFGKEIKKQRSIQVKETFGVIKWDMKFARFTRRKT